MLLCISYAFSQEHHIVRKVEPVNWWVGMKNPKLQLVLYGDSIGGLSVKMPREHLRLTTVRQVENPNYLFLDLEVDAHAAAGYYPIELYKGENKISSFNYELKVREDLSGAQGVRSEDLIYLIMPDRFANADTANDIVTGMREDVVNRDSMYYRHGGDIAGVINHLDYLHDLGVTAIWLTPVLTNDMPQASYHGYANTENYHVDPRLGTNETYRLLSKELHKRGMKLVHDVVPNHVGLYHWTVIDRPSTDWLHEWTEFTQTSYRDQTIFDPYGASVDRDKMEKGWFVATMPDLNHDNELVRKYITQSHIWWIEYAGVDGFRIDTYPYNDLAFMAEWTEAIRLEYPDFSFFGETWVHSVPNQAYFLGGQHVGQPIDTFLEGVTDFQLNYAIKDALTYEKNGANRLYEVLGSDYQYPQPLSNVIFLDNHDKDRFFSVVGEDLEKYKSAFAWLLTYRGIPQMYYGAEVLMKNFNAPDGLLREDFKGGFLGDEVNKFESSGRTEAEEAMFQHIRTLANYRKQNTVLHNGMTKHYVPEHNVYVYFRYNAEQSVAVFMNCSDEQVELPLARYGESFGKADHMRNILTGEMIDIAELLSLRPYQTIVAELIQYGE